jgi:hypothetical protein
MSRLSARDSIARPIDIGRLLQLTMAMPRQLRVFDHAEDQYRVWAIVRNVKLLEQTTQRILSSRSASHLSESGPRTVMKTIRSAVIEIAQSKLESAMWAAREDSGDQLAEVNTEDKRKESRQMIPSMS